MTRMNPQAVGRVGQRTTIKPNKQGDMSIHVVSVPHSGTRTLVEHLNAYTKYHFHNSVVISPRDEIHIPIRHPMSVARSWAERGKAFSGLLEAYRAMFRYMEGDDATYTLHPVEGLSGRVGASDSRPTTGFSVERWQEELRERVVRPHEDFFKQFYEDPYTED